MTGVEGMPFFERDEGDMNSLPAECYVAGFRLPGDDVPAARMTLPAELVDRAVLTGAQLSVWLTPRTGRLILDGEGVDDDTLEAALAAGPMRDQTLLKLIDRCLDPDHPSMEDDPVGDLISLRAQLAQALAKVDDALARLQRG
jgi:hypothetical protein